MSETPTTPGNGESGTPPTADAPSFIVLAQYLKDLSFENPRAPGVYQTAQTPQMEVSVDVNARTLSPDQYEVELSVSAKANHGDDAMFIVEACYGGAFEIKNIAQDQLEGVMLVECPRLLFPFMRKIIADATQYGNFPPLMLEPIDFMAIYLSNKQRQQQAGAAPAPADPVS